MVSKVIITPSEVRGQGNIVSPKETSNFTLFESLLSLSEGVYTLDYNGFTFVVTVSNSYVHTGNTVTVSVLVLDTDGDPVENASVDLYKEVE